MELQLNAPGEGDRFKGFCTPANKQMPLLIGEGRTPLSVAGLMSRYLELLELHLNAPEELKPLYTSLLIAWENNDFATGDGAVRHADGRMKVVLDAPYLRRLNPKTRRADGAVDLSDSRYAALAGEEFSGVDVSNYCRGRLDNRSGAKKNPIWLALARGDTALLSTFVDARFERVEERFRYPDKMMDVYAPPVPKEGAAGRLWCVESLNKHYGSGAIGFKDLDRYCGLLVGKAPEAQRGAVPTLEQRI